MIDKKNENSKSLKNLFKNQINLKKNHIVNLKS